ncbi:hypothetical protein [Pseudoduganella aquatica]|uniref:Uncharacterized protein n=1 Tax=Pseudoduganella aquatica TaxID=2660641 RepID=A0A7X4KLQ4_9BURK|nr:hypothetical protein [Pseudoduganella aquatica]MYN06326.1 hypothetical protein [Pseudoduganella aquatica]
MNKWQRRGLGILALGGGAIGFSSIMNTHLQRQAPSTNSFIAIVLATAFFLWGVYCGVQMLEGNRKALFQNAVFWLVQAPLLQSPALGYAAFCGAQAQVLVKLSPVEVGISGSVLGAQFGLNLGQPGERIAIGVNLFALCISFWLMQKYERAAPTSPLGAATSV